MAEGLFLFLLGFLFGIMFGVRLDIRLRTGRWRFPPERPQVTAEGGVGGGGGQVIYVTLDGRWWRVKTEGGGGGAEGSEGKGGTGGRE